MDSRSLASARTSFTGMTKTLVGYQIIVAAAFIADVRRPLAYRQVGVSFEAETYVRRRAGVSPAARSARAPTPPTKNVTE
jgi:hypothetical protein